MAAAPKKVAEVLRKLLPWQREYCYRNEESCFCIETRVVPIVCKDDCSSNEEKCHGTKASCAFNKENGVIKKVASIVKQVAPVINRVIR